MTKEDTTLGSHHSQPVKKRRIKKKEPRTVHWFGEPDAHSITSAHQDRSGLKDFSISLEMPELNGYDLRALLSLSDRVTFSDAVGSFMEISNSIREGLSLSVMDNLRQAGIERAYRDRIIPPRTMQHRQSKGETLSPVEGERAYRVANIVSRAGEVFGNHEKGLKWLHKPMKALEGKSPLDVLDNEPGARVVEDLLGRLDEGYFA